MMTLKLTEDISKQFKSKVKVEAHTASYLNGEVVDVDVINSNEKDYYDGHYYRVKVWTGTGYILNVYDVYANSAEEALEKVVAWAEKNDSAILSDVDELYSEIRNGFYADEYNSGDYEDESDFAENYLDYVYVDATMEGASKPYYVRGENLQILDGGIDENLKRESVNKRRTLGERKLTEADTDREEELRDRVYEILGDNDDILKEVLEELDNWNGYLGDNRYYPMDELEDFANGNAYDWIIKACRGSDADDPSAGFNPFSNYFRFDGYGDLVSTNYPDYSDQIDDYLITELIENYNNITIYDSELDEILKELVNSY